MESTLCVPKPLCGRILSGGATLFRLQRQPTPPETSEKGEGGPKKRERASNEPSHPTRTSVRTRGVRRKPPVTRRAPSVFAPNSYLPRSSSGSGSPLLRFYALARFSDGRSFLLQPRPILDLQLRRAGNRPSLPPFSSSSVTSIASAAKAGGGVRSLNFLMEQKGGRGVREGPFFRNRGGGVCQKV